MYIIPILKGLAIMSLSDIRAIGRELSPEEREAYTEMGLLGTN